MAQQPEKTTKTRTAKRPPRRVGTRRTTNGYVRRSSRRQTADVGALEDIIKNLEAKINALTSGQSIRSTVSSATDHMGSAVNRASHQVGDIVAEALTDVAGKLLGGANNVTSAARAGTGALQRIGTELERRPFMTVAIALGIGFLAGMVGRREQ